MFLLLLCNFVIAKVCLCLLSKKSIYVNTLTRVVKTAPVERFMQHGMIIVYLVAGKLTLFLRYLQMHSLITFIPVPTMVHSQLCVILSAKLDWCQKWTIENWTNWQVRSLYAFSMHINWPMWFAQDYNYVFREKELRRQEFLFFKDLSSTETRTLCLQCDKTTARVVLYVLVQWKQSDRDRLSSQHGAR